MVIKHYTEGYEGFCTFMEKFDSEGKEAHILFKGSIDPVTKENWCSDCVEAEPIIESKLPLLPKKSHLIIVAVGDRAFWKDSMNPFRTDKRIRLMVLPTIVRWKKPHRLEGDQLSKSDLVEMLFTEDIDSLNDENENTDSTNVKSTVSTDVNNCGCIDNN